MQVLIRLFSNYDPKLILTRFALRSNLVTQAFVWEKEKILLIIIVLRSQKWLRHIQLNEFMKVIECQRSRSFFDLG